MSAIRQALADRDPAALRLAAHTLKGAIRYFGGSEAFEHAFRLEQMGAKDALEGAEGLVDLLEAEVKALAKALAAYSRDNQTASDP